MKKLDQVSTKFNNKMTGDSNIATYEDGTPVAQGDDYLLDAIQQSQTKKGTTDESLS
jgi:hypothetical protein